MLKYLIYGLLIVTILFTFLAWQREVREGEDQAQTIRSLQDEVRVAERKLADYVQSQRDTYGGAEVPRYPFPIHPEDYIMPTSPYGTRDSIFFPGTEVEHQGVDLKGTWKARILAVAPGMVVEHWPPPGTPVPNKEGSYYEGHDIYGGMIKVEHDDGTIAIYAHLSKTYVHEWKSGEERWKVERGDLIGRQGDTGLAKGAHLHFELLRHGEHVNPLRYLTLNPEEIIESPKITHLDR